MAHLDVRVFIRATPERVWEVISDLPAQAGWMVDVRRLEVTSEQKSGVGAVIEVTSELFGLPLVKDTMRITAWEPPYRFDVEHVGQFSGTGSFIVEAAPGGSGSIFTWIEDFQPPAGPLGEAGFAIAVGPHLKRVFGRSLDNARRLAEEG
jgi:Polyketide cyclase / dehydrase and lipid transport